MIYKGFDLTGRVALVTGGSKGLGKAMARAFAEAGANVVISSRHESELRPALAEILAGTGREGRLHRRRHEQARRCQTPRRSRPREDGPRRYSRQQRRLQRPPLPSTRSRTKTGTAFSNSI